ncbi:MAG: hypothetical protein KQH79_17780 [Bacteroidetes bacterium]|nr:hypothetical protein [Bacteroidota bacterium]
MKSIAKTAISFFGLSIVLFFFVLGVYAQSNYTNILASNTNLSKRIQTLKSTTSTVLLLAQLDEQNSAKQIQSINDQTLSEVIEQKHKQLEEWMFDEFFWQVAGPIWNEEVIDEHKEIEPWMINISIANYELKGTTAINTGEKWVQKHNFFIL